MRSAYMATRYAAGLRWLLAAGAGFRFEAIVGGCACELAIALGEVGLVASGIGIDHEGVALDDAGDHQAPRLVRDREREVALVLVVRRHLAERELAVVL